MPARPAAPRARRGGHCPPAARARAAGRRQADDGAQDGTQDGTDVGADLFPGFERPGANFVLTPNQYLDLCVPHCSRGAVRIVGFLIRQVLGWSDRQGRPLRETVRVSYARIIGQAGVSRGAARRALEEAQAAGFVRQIAAGVPHRAGAAGRAAEFALNWDEGGGYADTPATFAGFYTGEGRRTMVPNAFFDRVLPIEPHGVVKVVAAVLRHTVGYTNCYTGLPQEAAPLSYRRLMAYADTDRRTLRRALPAALAGRYVRVVSEGRFRPGDAAGEASVYAVCWRPDGHPAKPPGRDGPETPPADVAAPDSAPPATVQNRPPAERPLSPLGDGPALPPENVQKCPPEASKIAPTRKTPSKTKQTQPAAEVASGGEDEAGGSARLAGALRAAGLAGRTADQLLADHGVAAVARQLAWLDARAPARSRAGMLRRAIEEAWPEPERARPSVPRPAPPAADDPAARRREREAHERRHRPAYLAAVAGHERALREARPDEHARFVAQRVGRRRDLERAARDYPLRVRTRLLAGFDADDARLAEFAAEFPAEVPGFWEWDRGRRGPGGGPAAG